MWKLRLLLYVLVAVLGYVGTRHLLHLSARTMSTVRLVAKADPESVVLKSPKGISVYSHQNVPSSTSTQPFVRPALDGGGSPNQRLVAETSWCAGPLARRAQDTKHGRVCPHGQEVCICEKGPSSLESDTVPRMVHEQRVAVLVRGFAFREEQQGDAGLHTHPDTLSAQMEAVDNQHRTVIDQLRNNDNVSVDVFLATYTHPRVEELCRAYKPVSMLMLDRNCASNGGTREEWLSKCDQHTQYSAKYLMRHAMNMMIAYAAAHAITYSITVILRFDLWFKQSPVLLPEFRETVKRGQKILFAFKSTSGLWQLDWGHEPIDFQWRRSEMIGDAVQIVPWKHLQCFKRSLDMGPCDHGCYQALEKVGVGKNRMGFLVAGFYETNTVYPGKNPLFSLLPRSLGERQCLLPADFCWHPIWQTWCCHLPPWHLCNGCKGVKKANKLDGGASLWQTAARRWPRNITNRTWRLDFRCGFDRKQPSSCLARCDAGSDFPCCNKGLCRLARPEHCFCQGCIDFRTQSAQTGHDKHLVEPSNHSQAVSVMPSEARGSTRSIDFCSNSSGLAVHRRIEFARIGSVLYLVKDI